MQYFRFLKRNVTTGLPSERKINPKRVLVLNKRTKYELEKALRPDIKEEHLENIIRRRGSDFDRLLYHHQKHKEYLNEIVGSFRKFNVQVEVVNRTCYGEKEADWADLIVVGGGDGTFLLGANKILNDKTPIVGFNTDPERSEGHLCLPKKYTFNISAAVDKIMKSDFHWLFRSRIETMLQGVNALDDVVFLDPTKSHNLTDCISCKSSSDSEVNERIIPSLALNEVFMGETISSQASHFLLEPSGLPQTGVKCSGLCVSTGTGSTSWHMSINRLTEDKVKKLLRFAGVDNPERVKSVTDQYNSSVMFCPESDRLGWSLREPIYSSVFPDPPGFPAGGLASEVKVTSRCFSGVLVVDGSYCCAFHDGTRARLRVATGRALRTIRLET